MMIYILLGILLFALLTGVIGYEYQHNVCKKTALFFSLIGLFLASALALITWTAALSVILFFLVRWKKMPFAGMMTMGWGFLCLKHLVPGFYNPSFFQSIHLTQWSSPYNLYLNLDKAFFALCLLLTSQKEKEGQSLSALAVFTIAMRYLGILVFTLLGIGVITGFVRFEAKIPSILLLWCLTNITVVMQEEVIYRLYLQRSLQKTLKTKIKTRWAPFLSIALPSIIFAFMDAKGLVPGKKDILYCLCTMIASLTYGTVYHKTKNIVWSGFVHFALNLIHILFFTYPSYQISR